MKNNASKNHHTPKKEEKKQKKDGIGRDKILIIAVIVIIVAFFGLFTLLKNQVKKDQLPQVEVKTYNGYVFEKVDNIWTTKLSITNQVTGTTEDYSIMFHYSPDEVENISTLKDSNNKSITPNLFLNMPLVYITTEPNYPGSVVLGGVEIAKIMAIVSRSYGSPMTIKSALTKPGNYSFPIATCANVTATQRIIYLELGNETKIDFQNGCVIVKGKDEYDLIRASERLAFEILRIL